MNPTPKQFTLNCRGSKTKFLAEISISLALSTQLAPAQTSGEPIPKPHLTITPSSANVILTWPTNAAGFTLQSTTNLVAPANWITNFPGPVVVNGLNMVTNPISGTQQFYRLIR